jgi:hypothetical protein
VVFGCSRTGKSLRCCVSVPVLRVVMRGRGEGGEVVRLDQVILALMDPGKRRLQHRNRNEDRGF